MNRSLTGALGAVLSIGASLALAEGGAASYAGDLIRPDGSSVRLTITVEAVTSDETTMALAELLLEKGLLSVAAEIAGARAGQLSFGEDVVVIANVIRMLDTEQGRVVSVVTDQPLIASPDGARASRGVGFIELRLGVESGGRLIPSADIVFGEDGFLEAKSLDGRELRIENVASGGP